MPARDANTVVSKSNLGGFSQNNEETLERQIRKLDGQQSGSTLRNLLYLHLHRRNKVCRVLVH